MLLFSLLLPFISVAPNRQHLVVQGGLRDTRSGERAMHMLMDSPRDSSLRGSVRQIFKHAPGAGAITGEIWNMGNTPDVSLSVTCFDRDSRVVLRKASRAKPSHVKWQAIRVRTTLPGSCERIEFVVEAQGPGSLSLDDAALADSQKRNYLTNPGFEQGWERWSQGDQVSHAGLLWVNDTTFVPWGLNYDRTILNGKDILLEEAPLDKIDRDFREARRIGANCVRLFLQLSQFMPRYAEMDESRLQFLDKVVLLARKRNLRVDLTGLSNIDAADAPEWYLERSPQEILEGERLFWETIARRYSNEPAIFMYNLQNEPYTAANDMIRKPVGCFKMSGERRFCYVNPHPKSIPAAQWTRTLVETIRRHDSKHLITIGLLPSAAPVFGGNTPGFSIPEVAGLLDVIAIHLYPDRPSSKEEFLDVNQAWLEMVLRYASGFGKPVIVEEWFPLFPPNSATGTWADWFPRFIKASKDSVCGWFTFYHALLVDGAAERQPFPNQQIELFAKHAAEMRNLTPVRKPGTATLKIDAAELWKNRDKAKEILREYRELRRGGFDVDLN